MGGREFFLLLTIIVSGTSGTRVQSSCELLQVEENSGLLTCTFSENINLTKHNFVVQRYDLDPNDMSPDYILQCSWLHSGRLSCKVKNDSCIFDNRVYGPDVSIKITSDLEGRYACQVVPCEPDDVKLCQYEHTTMNKTSPHHTSTVAASASSTTSHERKKEPESTVDIVRYIVIGLLGPVLGIIVTFIGMRLWRKREKYNRSGICGKRGQRGQNGSNDESNDEEMIKATEEA